jgi:hypothetical protein
MRLLLKDWKSGFHFIQGVVQAAKISMHTHQKEMATSNQSKCALREKKTAMGRLCRMASAAFRTLPGIQHIRQPASNPKAQPIAASDDQTKTPCPLP